MTLAHRAVAHDQPQDAVRHEDAELVSAIAAGDRSALRHAYERNAAAVMGAAVGVLRDRTHAEDVTQDVFLRLWDRPDRFDPSRASLRSFLQMDARGRAVDLVRSLRASDQREQADHASRASTAVPSTEELAMGEVVSAMVRDALRHLPAEHRLPIGLAFFAGHSYRDVAALLSLPEGTVKSRIRAGLQRLRLVLNPETAT